MNSIRSFRESWYKIIYKMCHNKKNSCHCFCKVGSSNLSYFKNRTYVKKEIYISYKLWDTCCRHNETLDASLRAICTRMLSMNKKGGGPKAKGSHSKLGASALPPCLWFSSLWDQVLQRTTGKGDVQKNRVGFHPSGIYLASVASWHQLELETSLHCLCCGKQSLHTLGL